MSPMTALLAEKSAKVKAQKNVAEWKENVKFVLQVLVLILSVVVAILFVYAVFFYSAYTDSNHLTIFTAVQKILHP